MCKKISNQNNKTLEDKIMSNYEKLKNFGIIIYIFKKNKDIKTYKQILDIEIFIDEFTKNFLISTKDTEKIIYEITKNNIKLNKEYNLKEITTINFKNNLQFLEQYSKKIKKFKKKIINKEYTILKKLSFINSLSHKNKLLFIDLENIIKNKTKQSVKIELLNVYIIYYEQMIKKYKKNKKIINKLFKIINL